MCGLIWYVQLVHYPMFSRFGPDAFRATMLEHQNRTTLIVAPVMLVELASGVWLLFSDVLPREVSLLNLAGLAVIWVATGFVQVPLHQRLLARLDPGLIQALVLTNWVRTLAWTARTVGLFALLARRG